MATESVVPDRSTDEKVENKMNEEIKTIEQEVVSPLKESEGTGEGEYSKSKELTSFEAPITDTQEKMMDKQIEMPGEDGSKEVKELDRKLEVSSSEPTIEAGEKEPKEQSEVTDVLVSSVEAIEKGEESLEIPSIQEPVSEVEKESKQVSESESKVVENFESEVPDLPISSVAAIEKPEDHSEVSPTQEPESEAVSKSESKEVEKEESVEVVEKNPEEQFEVTEGVEKKSDDLETKDTLEGEIKKEEGIESLKEEQTKKDIDIIASENSDTVVSTDQEAHCDPKETEGESILPDVIEKAIENVKKEETSALEIEKVQEEKEENNEKEEDTLKNKSDEGIESLKEEQPNKEHDLVASENSDTLVSTDQEAQSELKETEGESILPDVVEKTFENIEKEETVLEVEKVKEEKEENNVKEEDTLLDKSEDGIESLKEEEPNKEHDLVVPQSLDTVVSTDQEAHGELKETKGESILPDVAEKAIENIEKEKTVLEVEKVKEEKEEKNVKEEDTLLDKSEDGIESLKEEEPNKEHDLVTSQSSDTVVSTDQEVHGELKETKGESILPDVVEKAIENIEKEETVLEVEKVKEEKEEKNEKEEEPNKEHDLVASLSSDTVVSADRKETEGESVIPDLEEKAIENIIKEETEVDGVEQLSKEAVLEVEKTKEEKEEKNVKDEDNEANVGPMESTQLKTTKIEDVGGSDSAKEVVEESIEGEKASRDLDLVSKDEKDGNSEDIKPTSEGKVDDFNESSETVKEQKESELELKEEETLQSGIDKLEKAEEVAEEIAKSDTSILESSKTDADLPKQEIQAKTSQKQSNNIISKVKQSIVKVKKAIIGKSPSSKTMSSETKGDIKVK